MKKSNSHSKYQQFFVMSQLLNYQEGKCKKISHFSKSHVLIRHFIRGLTYCLSLNLISSNFSVIQLTNYLLCGWVIEKSLIHIQSINRKQSLLLCKDHLTTKKAEERKSAISLKHHVLIHHFIILIPLLPWGGAQYLIFPVIVIYPVAFDRTKR